MSRPLPIHLSPTTVPKNWGYELILCNNDEFCGKLLHFNKDARFSCHFHRQKREVFWLQRGKLKLMTIDTKDASQTEVVLSAGDVVEIPRFLPHQITALEESDMVEFSTPDYVEDSLRVLPGDSQKSAAT